MGVERGLAVVLVALRQVLRWLLGALRWLRPQWPAQVLMLLVQLSGKLLAPSMRSRHST